MTLRKVLGEGRFDMGLQAETEPIVKMFEDPETTKQMQSNRDGQMRFDYLADKHGFRQEFLETLSTFCRIHQCISINMLADKLNMTPEEAERLKETPPNKIDLPNAKAQKKRE
eukprot:bmy_17139T0